MAEPWADIPIDTKYFANVDEDQLTRGLAALENAFVNEAGGHTRFPGLREFVDLNGRTPVYVWADKGVGFRGNMMAVTGDGKVYEIGRQGAARDVTGTPLSGGRRPSFADVSNGLLIAAGGDILKYDGKETAILSEDAPKSSFVGYVDGFTLAVEDFSGRFQHTQPGQEDVWEPLDVFTADSQSDPINAMLVTPFRELLLAGSKSFEQFERLTSGEVPFFRRWDAGSGVLAPHTLTFADQAAWAVNPKHELVRISGQVADPASQDINLLLERITDWRDAWAIEVQVHGQYFILLQIPKAATPYDREGLTLIYDYRQKKWSSLYGWDDDRGEPAAWPGYSYCNIWGRHFVGGAGKIYELTSDVRANDGAVQRMYCRTAMMPTGELSVDNVRMQVKRGAIGPNDTETEVALRVTRERNGKRTPSKWKRKSLGKMGQSARLIEFGSFGAGDAFQIEYSITGTAPVDVMALQWQATRLGL